jgi:hypothetical protein
MDKIHIVGQLIKVEQIKHTYQFTIDDGTELIKINEAELTVNDLQRQGRNLTQINNYLSVIFEIENIESQDGVSS